MKKLLAIVLTLVLALVLCACQEPTPPAPTNSWPVKDVTIIVPFGAGGGTDVVARALAEAFKLDTEVNVVVENHAGAAGAIGMTLGANANPDGYVVTVIALNLAIFTNTNPDCEITIEDLIPVCMFNSRPHAITVKADAPYNTYDELIDYMTANPGTLNIGHGGVGSATHFAALGWLDASKVEAGFVPFGGMNDAITSLLGGHIDIVCASVEEVAKYVASGDLKTLAVMGDEKHPLLNTVPTLKELGLDYAISTWMGLAVPAGTPEDVVSAIDAAFKKAMEGEYFTDFMKNSNFTIDYMGPTEFKAQLESDYLLFKDLAEAAGF